MPDATLLPPRIDNVAGVPVGALAESFGTPLYVYHAEKILERLNDLRRFDSVRFAQKACSSLAVVDLLRRHGALVDAVSAYEILRAIRAGYSTNGEPPPVCYTADIFDRAALDVVAEYGIHVNCGSPDMLGQLAERLGGQQITLRINPGFGHGHSQKTNTGGEQSKHGIWHEQLSECVLLARRLGHVIVGLHMHIGSGTDLAHLAEVCGAMQRAALVVGGSLRTISAGGGLPVPYRAGQKFVDVDAYFELWDAARKNLEHRFGHKLHLEIEPGRYLTAESGYLLSEIRAVKRMGDNTYYLVDAGFNNLARPILYGAYHPMAIASGSSVSALSASAMVGTGGSCAGEHGQQAASGTHVELQAVVVGGPLCESGDIFTQEEGGFVSRRELPPAQVGDYLVIGVAGAYGAVMGSNYNSKPLAAEVLIQNGQPHLIRARQAFEDVIRGEAIPPPD